MNTIEPDTLEAMTPQMQRVIALDMAINGLWSDVNAISKASDDPAEAAYLLSSIEQIAEPYRQLGRILDRLSPTAMAAE